jgi:hypothetical protein
MARLSPKGFGGAAALVAVSFLAAPACADAIDGDWCFRDGKHFTIAGPSIVTPAGIKTTGNYDRHAFSYVVPAPEPRAGDTVAMVLINDLTLHLRLPPQSTEIQVWRRCEARTS